ncbi:MAG: hypothetical protein OEL57_00900 [Trichlorobacter sp.]|uniref:hypothetical protein n=1 Tax=Trichlorobacter sp. TaxID=2911007 RepID=UPI002560328D|nr:hypothetical protein [Trichlorobacter sp.]MDK9716448.1 hypothetical protein [Trichlorobacter sp.]
MTLFEQQRFLEGITHIKDVDFMSWQGWELLMSWVRQQAWRVDFFGGEKIPSRLLYPKSLTSELIGYMAG